MDGKINKLIDIYLEGSLSLEEYQRKKEAYLNEKKDLQERLKDFAAGGDNWFERAKDFVTDLNRVGCVLREGNLESQREYLEKIGSNFILKMSRISFSSEGTFRPYLSNSPYQNWRTRVQPIRTASELPVLIRILPCLRIPLYQRIAQKVEELVILGMPLKAIAQSLKVSQGTIKKARKHSLSLRGGPPQAKK